MGAGTLRISCYKPEHRASKAKAWNSFNAQYPTLTVKRTTAFHDRFLIIDGVHGYHIGSSLKDAGKKCFGINKIESVDVLKDIMSKAQQTGV